MKRVPLWLIIVWSLLALLGIATLVVGGLTGLGLGWRWAIALVLWAGAGVWIALRLPAGRRTGPGARKAAYTGDQLIYRRVAKETNEAVARYVKTANTRGILRKDVLFERPWFLLCGSPKAGKTSLLKGSGLSFPVTYPSEADGLMIEGSRQASWYFANEAVWIDTPGSFMDEAGKQEWQALAASLGSARPGRPIDGIAIVVNAHEVLNTDERGIRDLARSLRARIDEVIALWGIEFPVYLIFNHADTIPGFNEYFDEDPEKMQSQLFGATLPVEKRTQLPRVAFAEEFGLLSRSLNDFRLDRLQKERAEARKRMVCRFVIHFEGMQEKLGALVAELFKPSSYVGKPIFRGFYFTSCRTTSRGEPQPAASPNVSMTIVNHPLNPKKMLAPEAGAKQAGPTTYVTSLFVLPLFRKIMVLDKSLVKHTRKRSQMELVRYYLAAAGVALAVLVAGGLILAARNASSSLLSSVERDAARIPREKVALLDQYATLDILARNIARLEKSEGRGRRLLSLGLNRGAPILDELRKSYVAEARQLMVVPAVKYFEYAIEQGAQNPGELSGEDYTKLYDALKAYLSISEAVSSRPQDIDTVFLRTALLDGIKRALLVATQRSHLPEQVETILQDDMGLYLRCLRQQKFPPIQENQRLVADARRRLQRLPDAQSLYQTVINRLAQDAPQLTLDQLLSRTGEGILKSAKTVSTLYTQQGWDQRVNEALVAGSKDPFKLDWVLGLAKDDVPESMIDTRKLHADMVDAYVKDCTAQWLAFLGAVSLDPFGDLPRCSRMLQKLAAGRSELEVLLEQVGTLTTIKATSEAEALAGKALDAASKLKGVKGTIDKGEKAYDAGADKLGLGRSSPFDPMNSVFDPLRAFARSTAGSMSGLLGYRDKVSLLAEKLAAMQGQGEQSALDIFNGKESDPLLTSWSYVQREFGAMPEGLASALQGPVATPIKYTGDAVSQVLSKTLNTRWQGEIVKPFTNRFSGRYPFSRKGEEASFTDVMDFFRPATGTFWGFYDRVLSPFLVKNASGWMVRQVGSLTLNFNPAVAQTLIRAERIRDIFFKPDGTLRSMAITLTPSADDKYPAKLTVNGQICDLSGGKSAQLNWPIEAPSPGASLKVSASGDFTQEISFGGPWGFMKLLAAAMTQKVNNSTIMARWEISVQNTYTIQIAYRVQVAGADHPFGDPVFGEMDCPTDLIRAAPQTAANR